MKYDIVTIGDVLQDVFVEPELTVKADRSFGSGKGICFEFGEKVPLSSVQYEVGGSACNTAVGFTRLGFKSSIIAMLGRDEPQVEVVKRLHLEKVETQNLIIQKNLQTGYSVIFSIDGDRTIFVFHGPKDYSNVRIPADLETDWFYLSPLGHNTDELEARLISYVSEKGTKIAWNPGSIQIEQGANHFRHLLRCTSVLFLNREEAIKFLNFPVRPQMKDIFKKLFDFGVKVVAITNGKEGADASFGHEIYHLDAVTRVHKVDVTGAGDAFATGFLARLAAADFAQGFEPSEIKEALSFGIKNSTSVIQYIGAQKGLLRKSDLVQI